MKKIIAVLCLMIFLGTAAYAQTAIAGMTYQVSVPMDNTKDFIDKASFVGFGVEGRRFIGDNFSLGLSFQWNTFREEVRDEGLPSTPEVNLNHNRDMSAYPLLLTTHAYLRPSEKFFPYVGIGVGTFRIHQRADATTQVWKRDSWHWGVAPEVGFIAKIGFDVGLTASLKYNYALKTSEAPAQSYVTVVVGFLWVHH
ncbi:MAG: outer membrane beta-barrel protein [Candidatus Aminicenantes bacterium]|nr:outer membrane beta-barrel protein [Candidatus Aminicenantes bacterium]